jgi:hypothetical protein
VSKNIVDNVPLAMGFNDKSAMQLSAPGAVADPVMDLKTSFSFKQEKQGDAMLMYMGNGDNPSAHANMALYIKDDILHYRFTGNDGRVYKMNITDHKILKDQWYKVTVLRNAAGYNLHLSRRDGTNIITRKAHISTKNTVPSFANFGGKNNAHLYVAGMYGGANRPAWLPANRFHGGMEGLMVNRQRIGFWNARSLSGVGGSKRGERDVDRGEYSFNGKGFTSMQPYPGNSMKKIEAQFITLAPNGTILLAYNKPATPGGKVTFFALEMRDGYLVSKYDFGSGYQEVQHTSAGKLNDGMPHVFRMRARGGQLKFYVDNTGLNAAVDVKKLQSADRNFALNTINLGGVPYETIHTKVFPSG